MGILVGMVVGIGSVGGVVSRLLRMINTKTFIVSSIGCDPTHWLY